MVFKTAGKLKTSERWWMNGQNIEMADKFNYLWVTLESTGGLNEQKMLTKTKGSSCSQRQMYISNPQYYSSDVREYVRNGMWIKGDKYNWDVGIMWNMEGPG